VLRHQLIVFAAQGERVELSLPTSTAGFLVQMYRWFRPILKVVTIVQPETLGALASGPAFVAIGRWKSKLAGEGGPRNRDRNCGALIRQR